MYHNSIWTLGEICRCHRRSVPDFLCDAFSLYILGFSLGRVWILRHVHFGRFCWGAVGHFLFTAGKPPIWFGPTSHFGSSFLLPVLAWADRDGSRISLGRVSAVWVISRRRGGRGSVLFHPCSANKALQRTGAWPFSFMIHWIYNIIRSGEAALPAPVAELCR